MRFISNAAILLLSTAISLSVAEIVVRFIAPQNLSGSWREESKKGGYQVNKDSGESRHQLGDRVVRYRFDRHHLRVGPLRSNAPRKVLVLGDSFTFGWLLNWPDSYVGRLQRAADDAFGANTLEFLNAAAGGWGTSDYVAYYEDYGSDLEVRTVVVFINTDDIGRSVQSNIYSISGGTLQRSPLRQSSRLKNMINSIPFYQIALEKSHILQLLRVVALGLLRSAPTGLPVDHDPAPIPRSIGTDSEASTQLAKELFRRMFRLARERRHKLIVLTTGWHKFKAVEPNEPTAAFMGIANQFFRENGIYFADLSQEVYELSHGTVNGISIKNDGHPNEFGARLISQSAWGVLRNTLE